MAEAGKKDDALAAAVRDAFKRHMDTARGASASTSVVTPARQATDITLSSQDRIAPPPVGETPAAAPQASSSTDMVREWRRAQGAARAMPEPVMLAPPPEHDAAEASLAMPIRRVANGRAALPAPEAPAALPAPPRALAPPLPANDREARLKAHRERQRQAIAEEQAVHRARAAERNDPAGRSRPAGRKLAVPESANANPPVIFGTGARPEARRTSTLSWIVFGALVAACAGCAGIGAYLWLQKPASVQHILEAKVPPLPPAQGPLVAASAPAPAAKDAPPTQTAAAVAPPSAAAATTPTSDALPVRIVKVAQIDPDEIARAGALSDALTLLDNRDATGARRVLEPFRASGDPRILMGLAETYDPHTVPPPPDADAAKAQELYEAAKQAGSKEAVARLAILAAPRN